MLAKAFALGRDEQRSTIVSSAGPGNMVAFELERADGVRELVAAFGEKGRSAEKVAADVVEQAQRYLELDVPVGEHLADQLLLPLLLVGGRFATGPLSSHAETNIELIRAFLGESVITVQAHEDRTLVEVARCI